MGKWRLLAMLLVLGTGLLGTEVWLTPLTRALAGEPYVLWWSWRRAEASAGGGEGGWRWRVMDSDGVVAPDFPAEWQDWTRVAESDVLLRFQLMSGYEQGNCVLGVECLADGEVRELARVAVSVIGRSAVGERESCRIRRDQAVMRALRWLQLHQEADGHWGVNRGTFEPMGSPLAFVDEKYNESASTAFALWAFGSHGYGLTEGAEHVFSDTVRRGVAYILSRSIDIGTGSGDYEEWKHPRDDYDFAWWQEQPERYRYQGVDDDCNGNERMVILGGRSNAENYAHPICLSGLVSAGYPRLPCRLPSGREGHLQAIVEDARDFIVWQLGKKEKVQPGWGYCFGKHMAGHDLSIAGWNFLGLEAGRAWGLELDRALQVLLGEYISKYYDPFEKCFLYHAGDFDSETISLNSSGLLGIAMLHDAHPGHGFMLRGNVGYYYHDSTTGNLVQVTENDPGVPSGEVQAGVTAKVFYWLKNSNLEGAGYNLWNACKALLMQRVTTICLGQPWYDWYDWWYWYGEEEMPEETKVVYDWRYGGDDGSPGVWDKVMSLQRESGVWPKEAYGGNLTPNQQEMHHALMTLSLSEHVLRQPVAPTIPVEVALKFAPEATVVSGLPEGLSWQAEEGVLSGRLVLSSSCPEVALNLGYAVGEGEGGTATPVQVSGSVLWEDEREEKREEVLGALSVQRVGTRYGVSIQWGEGRWCHEPNEVHVEVSLPEADCLHVLRIPAGQAQGEFSLYTSDRSETWQSLEVLSGELSGLELIQRHDERGRWQPWGLGQRARELGVRVEQVPERDVFLLLGSHGRETRLIVEVEQGGRIWQLANLELRPQQFGQRLAWTLPVTAGMLTPGAAVCRAVIRGGEQDVCQAEERAEFRMAPAGVIRGALHCPEIVRAGAMIEMESSVATISGVPEEVQGTVQIFGFGWEQPLGQWAYDGRHHGGVLRRVLFVPSESIAPGTYEVRQEVALSDGRMLLSTAQLEIVATRASMSGAFDEEHVTLASGTTAEVGYEVSQVRSLEEVVVQLWDETGQALELTGTQQLQGDEKMRGDVQLEFTEEWTGRTVWLSLLDQEAQTLLDVMSIAVTAPEVPPVVVEPEPQEPEDEPPVAIEPEPQEPEDEPPVAIEPEPQEPEDEPPVVVVPEPQEPEPPVVVEPEPQESEPPVANEPEPQNVEPEPPVQNEPEPPLADGSDKEQPESKEPTSDEKEARTPELTEEPQETNGKNVFIGGHSRGLRSSVGELGSTASAPAASGERAEKAERLGAIEVKAGQPQAKTGERGISSSVVVSGGTVSATGANGVRGVFHASSRVAPWKLYGKTARRWEHYRQLEAAWREKYGCVRLGGRVWLRWDGWREEIRRLVQEENK